MTSKWIIVRIAVFPLLLLALSPAWAAGTQNSGHAQRTIIRPEKAEDLPDRGMSMHAVEKKYGKPAKTLEPTGKPPITRWIYKEFTVYFEGRYVIHAVINHPVKPPQAAPDGAGEAGNKPIKTAD